MGWKQEDQLGDDYQIPVRGDGGWMGVNSGCVQSTRILFFCYCFLFVLFFCFKNGGNGIC